MSGGGPKMPWKSCPAENGDMISRFRHSGLYLGAAPGARVTHEDAGGKKYEKLMEIPSDSSSLSFGAKKRVKR